MNKNKLVFGLVMVLALLTYSIFYYAFFVTPRCDGSEITKTLHGLVRTDLTKQRLFGTKIEFVNIKESSFEEGVRTCEAILVLTDISGLKDSAPRKYDIRKSEEIGVYDITLY